MVRDEVLIGDKFYRSIPVAGTMEYVVIGVRKYEDSVQYELRCESCNHNEKCEVLITIDDGNYYFMHMLNNLEDDCAGYAAFHRGNNEIPFFRDLKKAKIYRLRKSIKYRKDVIKDLEDKIDANKKALSELENAMDLIK